MKNRPNVINELHESERKYVGLLQDIVREFKRPLQQCYDHVSRDLGGSESLETLSLDSATSVSSSAKADILARQEVNEIFGQTEEICQLQTSGFEFTSRKTYPKLRGRAQNRITNEQKNSSDHE